MTRRRLLITSTALLLAMLPTARAQEASPPLRLAIAGLVHGHVTGFLRSAQARHDVEIVGVFDPDATLLHQYGQRYKIADAALFTSLDTMIDRRPSGSPVIENNSP